MENSQESFSLDTKRVCLLCFQAFGHNDQAKLDPCHSKNQEEDITSDIVDRERNEAHFHSLFRFLGINSQKLIKSTFLPSSSVTEEFSSPSKFKLFFLLCDKCSSLAKNFTKLFDELELIKMRLDAMLGKLSVVIRKSSKNQALINEYKRRIMKAQTLVDADDLRHATILEKIRREVAKKCKNTADLLFTNYKLILVYFKLISCYF